MLCRLGSKDKASIYMAYLPTEAVDLCNLDASARCRQHLESAHAYDTATKLDALRPKDMAARHQLA